MCNTRHYDSLYLIPSRVWKHGSLYATGILKKIIWGKFGQNSTCLSLTNVPKTGFKRNAKYVTSGYIMYANIVAHFYPNLVHKVNALTHKCNVSVLHCVHRWLFLFYYSKREICTFRIKKYALISYDISKIFLNTTKNCRLCKSA